MDHTRRTRGGSWGSRSWAPVIVFGALLAGATAAFAYWAVDVIYASGSFALAKASSLSAPTAPTETVNGSGAITIGWTLPGSQLAGAQYQVMRTSGPGSPSSVCTVAFSVTSCQDTGLAADATYGYSITAILDGWQSSSITTSATTSTPTFAIGLSAAPYTAGLPITVQTVTAMLGAQVDTTYAGTKTITWSGLANSPSGHAPSYPVSSMTFVNGVASPGSPFTAYAAATSTLVATDASASAVTGSTSLNVAAASAGSLSLSGATTTPTAGVGDNLTITAQDSFGNTATGYTGSKNLSFSGASSIGTHTPTVSNSSGSPINFGSTTTITFSSGVAGVAGATNGVMALYKAGAASITVTDGSIGNGSGLSVIVGPASAASLSLAAATTTPTEGVGDNLTITALDAFGNTATGYTGPKNLTFGGAGTIGSHTPTVSNSSGSVINFGSTTAITFSSGVAAVSSSSNGVMTLYKAETTSITVSDGSITNGAGLSVTVSGAPAASLSLAAATTTPTAGAGDNLTITALDTFGNTATGYTGSKNLTFGGASTIGTHTPTVSNSSGSAINFGSTTAITFSNGVASVSASTNGVMTLYKAGAARITVTDGSIGNGTGLAASVNSAGVVLSFSPNPGVVTKNTSTTFTITVPLDQYGNAFTSSSGVVVNLTLGSTTNWGFGSVGTGTAQVTITTGPASNTFTVAESGANKSTTLSGTTSAPGFTAPSVDTLTSSG